MTSTTSRSLHEVPDILYHVFSYLDPIHQSKDDEVYESRRSLALAARTCRGFTVPALDVLWKRLPDDQPLADLLCHLGIAARDGIPRYLEHLGKKPERYRLPYQDGGGYRLRCVAEAYEERWRLSRGYDLKYFLRTGDDPRTHPNWPRFMEYASRVRAITLFVFDGPAWSALWEELLAVTHRAPILPKLLSVAFRSFSSQTLNPGAFALISPSVCNLNLNVDDDDGWRELDEKFRSIFTQSFNAAPMINKLRLEFRPSSLGLSLLQTHCSHLLQLEVFPLLHLDGLQLLTELPALQHLSVSLSRDDFPPASAPLTFNSVTTLVVEGTWVNLGAFFATARLPSMHTLSVTGWDYGEPAAELAKAATQCFRTLASQYSSLTNLQVSATHGRVPPSRGCVVYGISLVHEAFESSLLDLVHPLLALSALRRLELGFPSYFDIVCTEADLRAVAEAFPALEAFHLRVWHYFGFALENDSDNDPPERPRGGPLGAIAHFARSCPKLRLLHLPPMEMTDGPLAALGDEERASEPHGLQTLIIPKVLLPPGRADLARRVPEVVRGIFPLAASPFRPERLSMEDDWAVADGASRCPDCGRGSRLPSS